MTEHDEEVFFRLRRRMDNKNYKQWEDHWQNNVPVDADFQKFRIEATQWNEPMLRTMHKTIRLEGRPNTKATKVQSDSGSS